MYDSKAPDWWGYVVTFAIILASYMYLTQQ